MGTFKYTAGNLKKLEALLGETGYVVRYEKGNFQSGYCMVQDKKIAIVNRFFDTEGRINCLLEILQSIAPEPSQLSEASQKLLRQLNKRASSEETDEPLDDVHKQAQEEAPSSTPELL